MRVDAEGEVGGWHSFSPVETASRAVPRARSEGEPNQAGVQVSCAGVSDNRVNSPPGASDSDFPPPVQSRGLSSSSRARPLFWLCQSPPLAWPVSLVTVPVHPRSRLPRESDLVFLCQFTSLCRSSIQATPPAAGWDQDPESLQHSPERERACCRVGTQGPQGCPCPTMSA